MELRLKCAMFLRYSDIESKKSAEIFFKLGKGSKERYFEKFVVSICLYTSTPE